MAAPSEPTPGITEEQAKQCSVTFRSICIGAALVPITCMWVIQCEILWYSGQPTTVSLMPHVVFVLFLLTLFNLAVGRLLPGSELNPGELLTIYVMLTVGSVVTGHDSLQILVPSLVHGTWGPESEVGWSTSFVPHLPRWALVTDMEVVEGFYEGGQSMYTAKVLKAWAVPVLWWSSFVFALVGSLFLINTLLRKQWTENEKLSYPIVQIPLMMATKTKSLFRSKLLWYGFALAAAIDLYNGLATFYPILEPIPIVHIDNLATHLTERPWNAIGTTWFSLYPFAIGVCFFLPVDLAFSCWFFFIFWKAQRVLVSAFGWQLPGLPFVNDQTGGGYLALCLVALWVSRRYLKELFRHVFFLSKEPRDESDEALPSRVSVLLLVLCVLYLALFMHWLGMVWWIIPLFLLIYFAIAIAIARMRAELGPPAHDLHYGGPDQMLPKFFGTQNLGKSTLVALSLMWFFNRAYRGHAIAPSLEGYKIAQQTRMSARRMLLAMVIALAISTFGGFWAMLHIGYKYGAEASILGPARHFG